MGTETAIAARIHKSHGLFSASENKIAAYTLEHQDEFIRETAEDVAMATNTSSATVIRFARRLGFKGFADMKLFMIQSAAGSFPSAAPAQAQAVLSDNPVIEENYLYNRTCVDELVSGLDLENYRRAVDVLDEAETIYLVAAGASGSTTMAAYDALLKLGMNCVLISDGIFQVMNLAACQKPEKAVAMCVCHSGRVRDVLDAMEVAKKRGMKTIGIMGYEEVPLMKLLDVPLLMHSTDHGFFSDSIAARICELYLISFLYSGIVEKRGIDTVEKARAGIYEGINMKRVK